MKILFKNRTKYTKSTYQEFLNFHQEKYGPKYQFYTAIILILIFFCFAMQVKYHKYTLAILFACSLTAFFLWRFFHPLKQIKKEMESEKITKEKEFSFRFFEKHFEISDKQKIEKMKYYKLLRVFETKTFFYLYIDKNHAFLLSKNSFVIGSPEEFSKFIKKKCPFHFKKCC